MKGTAHPDSLTGKVQSALTDEWQTQSQIAARAGLYDYKKPTTLRALLERLVSEGRAEWKIDRQPQVHIVRWRRLSVSERREREADKPTGDARILQRAEGPQPLTEDDGNAGTPVAPTPKGER